MALGPKQARFVDEYLVDLNATQAAIRAGYSPKTARAQGHRLLTKADVQQAIGEGRKRQQDRLEVKADDILRELLRVARSDIGEAFFENGSMKPLKDMPEDVRRSIAGVEVDELYAGGGENRVEIGQTRKVKLWNKVQALELLGKHLALWTDKHELTGAGGSALSVTIDLGDKSG